MHIEAGSISLINDCTVDNGGIHVCRGERTGSTCEREEQKMVDIGLVMVAMDVW